MNYVAGWNYILCAAFITIDVLCRNFGGFSSSAATEITSYMLAFGVAWGWPMRWRRAPTSASTSWSIACPLACASISTHLPCFCRPDYRCSSPGAHAMTPLEPIAVEVIRNALTAAAAEMDVTI
jgi:hypothetical protein